MWLVYLLVIVMPLSEHPFWALDLGGKVTPFKILGMVTIGYAVLVLARKGALPPLLTSLQAKLFLAIYAMVTAWVILGNSPATQNEFLHWTSFFALLFILVSVVDSMDKLRWVLLCAVTSGSLAALYAVRSWQKYHGLYEDFRASGVTGDPNYLALAITCFLPVAFRLMIFRKRLWERAVYLAGTVLGIAGLLIGGSRGGFVGLVAMVCFLVLRAPHWLRNLAFGIVLLVPFCVLPGSPIDRILNPGYGDQVAVESRFVTWNAALRMVQANPLLGVGPGEFRNVVLQYEPPGVRDQHIAHNTYLELFAELGIPAGVTFLALLAATLWSLEKTRRRAIERSRLLAEIALALEAGAVGCAVCMIFLTAAHQKCLWLLVFLSICLEQRVKHAARPEVIRTQHERVSP